jgi:hypothetical protein
MAINQSPHKFRDEKEIGPGDVDFDLALKSKIVEYAFPVHNPKPKFVYDKLQV